MTEKVDIVYLWVNGNDENFQKERTFWKNKLGIPETNDNSYARYIENEELRYSMRSVAMNAPWINKIYIVTNGQIPDWLDTTNPKIKIVTHKEIMPDEILPTYNSLVIESYVADIPELSEHFLLANDDCYISRPVVPSFFFDKQGKPIVRLVRQKLSDKCVQDSLYFRTIRYALDAFKEKYPSFEMENCIPHHSIDAYSKTSYKECIKEFQVEFDKLRVQKFRGETIQRIIQAFYLIGVKQSKYELVKRDYSNYKSAASVSMRVNTLDWMIERLCKKRPALLCINDITDVTPEQRRDARLLYETLYPVRQKWEKTEVKNINKEDLQKCKRLYGKISQKILYKRATCEIFSTSNETRGNKKYKVYTILGIRIKKRIKGKSNNEQCK